MSEGCPRDSNMQADLRTTALRRLNTMVATVGLLDSPGTMNSMGTSEPLRVVTCPASLQRASQP